MKRKAIAALLTAGLVMSVFAGCGSTAAQQSASADSEQSQESAGETATAAETAAAETNSAEEVSTFEHDPNLNEVGTEPIAKETVTLTVGIRQHSNVEDYETNYLTNWLEEMANVDLQFVEYPDGEMAEKIRLMAAAGGDDLPDILICNLDDATVNELAENEMILPLDDYYKNCSVYYKEGFERVLSEQGTDLYKLIEAGDGHIYTVPKYNETLTNPAQGRIWVYQPWLDAVGMKAEDIVTTEDFYNMLDAFKTQDPNGNGKADEIPALSTGLENNAGSNGGAFIDSMMSAFLPCTSSLDYLNAKDGEIYVSYNQDAWKEGIKYLNDLCEKGLFDPVSFTTNTDSFKTIMNSEGDQLVGCFAYLTPSFIQKTHSSYGKWTLLKPLTGPEGVCTTPYKPDVPTNGAFITMNCENPELAFRFLDLMGREDVAITSRWGVEGENWSYVEDLTGTEYAEYDFTKTFSGYPALFYQYNSCWNVAQNNHWQNINPSFRTAEVAGGYYASNIAYPVEGDYNLELAEKLSAYEAVKPEELIAKIKYSSEAQAEASELTNALTEYVKEKMALWITGAADVEAEWEDYLAELDKIGLTRYLELTQEAYDNMK